MAEMTGRRGRVVKTDKQPKPHYETRECDSNSVDSLNIQEVMILLLLFCENISFDIQLKMQNDSFS